MKSLISLTVLSLALSGAPVLADAFTAAGLHAPQLVLDLTGADDVERRGRGGRDGGGRDGASDDRGGGGGGHGGRPRIPGGSGCDDPHDLIEHPECRG